ncbi:MAG: hypothetical protein IH957_12930 [Chloroflexi bacterium]|nr:hypothetical protein [Chloroflexota bacterium]
MKHLLAPTALIATVAILFSAVTPAHACSCAQPSVEEIVANADIVAIATVTRLVDATEMWGITGVPDRDGIASVERYLKGSGPAEITVDDPSGDGDCGFLDETDVGERHLFFLTTDDGAYKTHLCSGNALLTGEFVDEDTVNAYLAEVEAVTGPGHPPDGVDPTSTADNDLPREVFWALAILLPIAVLATATLVAARRR